MSFVATDNQANTRAGPAAARRVLLVDDDRDIVHCVAVRLRNEGYETLMAHDGATGVEMAQTHLPDGIVLDMRMPVLDGVEVLKALRNSPKTAAIPVVVLSASVMDKGKSTALDLGARYFLEKPYDARRLIEALRAAMAGGTKSGE